MYYEVSIIPSPSGFGEYQCQPINGEGWADARDLLAEIGANIGDTYRLGVDPLPDGLDDISGSVRDAPEAIYGYLDDEGRPQYFAIQER